LRIGVPREFFFARLDGEVRMAVERALGWFATHGARLREVRIAGLPASEQAGTDIALPEATAFHSRQGWWPRHARDYSVAVRKRLALAANTRAVDYLHAFHVQRQLQLELADVFSHVDVLLTPTTPIPAPRRGEKIWKHKGNSETIRAALLRLCRPANLSTWPALTIPCGFTRGGLPIGLQIMSASDDLAKGMAAAHAYEQAHPWHRMHPPIADLPE
jgi:Asp-tRNA(Asn)/Glu-tRNA(Gln) amidotransferase A subunit family amidase